MSDPSVHLQTLLRRYPALAPLAGPLRQGFDLLLSAVREGGIVLLCGNGGSASDASHIAGELLKSLAKPRRLGPRERALFGPGDADLTDRLENAVPAISLADQGAIHSAIANDVAAEMAFAQLVWGLGREGDVLWAISTSGKSPNVVNALRVARAKKMRTLGLLGRGGGACAALCDVALDVPGLNTQEIQELHLPIYHALCMMLEEALF